MSLVHVRARLSVLLETSEGFFDVGSLAAWHKALIVDFVSLGADLDAI